MGLKVELTQYKTWFFSWFSFCWWWWQTIRERQRKFDGKSENKKKIPIFIELSHLIKKWNEKKKDDKK